MRRLIQGYLKDSLGNIIQGASYYVYKTGTTDEANIYTTLTSSTPATQPLTTDASGKFSFYVSDLDYGSTQLFDIYFPSTVNTTFSSVKGETILTTYDITSNTTVSYPIKIPYGVVFNISSGVTLTINGVFEAGLYRVFSGDGSVSFGVGSIAESYPEWFGAVGDGITDCTSFIQKAVESFNVVAFNNKSIYKVTSKITIPNHYTIIKGNYAVIHAYCNGEPVFYAESIYGLQITEFKAYNYLNATQFLYINKRWVRSKLSRIYTYSMQTFELFQSETYNSDTFEISYIVQSHFGSYSRAKYCIRLMHDISYDVGANDFVIENIIASCQVATLYIETHVCNAKVSNIYKSTISTDSSDIATGTYTTIGWANNIKFPTVWLKPKTGKKIRDCIFEMISAEFFSPSSGVACVILDGSDGEILNNTFNSLNFGTENANYYYHCFYAQGNVTGNFFYNLMCHRALSSKQAIYILKDIGCRYNRIYLNIPFSEVATLCEDGGSNWVSGVEDADTIDGYHASQTPTADTIPVAGSDGKLNTGWLQASQTPTANTIPVADADGRLNAWVDVPSSSETYSRLTVATSFPPSPNHNDLCWRSDQLKLYKYNVVRGTWSEVDWETIVKASPEWQEARLRINSSTGKLEISPNGTDWYECIPAVGNNSIELTTLDNSGFSYKYWIAPGQTAIIKNAKHVPIVYAKDIVPFFSGSWFHTYSYSNWVGLRPSNIAISNADGQYMCGSETSVSAGRNSSLSIVPILEQSATNVNWANFELRVMTNNRFYVNSLGKGSGDNKVLATNCLGPASSTSYWLGTWYTADGGNFTVNYLTLTRRA